MQALMRTTLTLLAVIALAGCATTSEPTGPDFVAQFNEPFLTFISDGKQLTRTSPENTDGVIIAATRSTNGDETRFAWQHDGATHELLITQQQCFDDMAGFEFSHRAQLLDSRSDAGFTGCARLTSEPQPREL